MDAKTAEDPKLLAHYEGLVRKTAARVEPIVEEDYDDICQFLRVKVWKALQAFTAKRVKPTAGMTLDEKRDRFVFACLTNAVKDVLKKKRHHLLFIEDLTAERTWNGTAQEDFGSSPGAAWKFEARYLTEEDIAAQFEQEAPLIPSTLSPTERRVLLLLYVNFKPSEIATQIGRKRRDVDSIVESIQGKMADWAPTAIEQPAQVAV